MSSLPGVTTALKPSYSPDGSHADSSATKSLIKTLNLQSHPEGGWFVETDRDTLRVPTPASFHPKENDSTRSASTTIFYFLSPSSPQGYFHRNKARTVHTLHKGRGRYVLIYADELSSSADRLGGLQFNGKARIETFIVGQDVENGERLQWIVEGGKFKASFLLPDDEGGEGSDGLLISETVVPGFEFGDHDFLGMEGFEALVTDEQKKELEWLVRKE